MVFCTIATSHVFVVEGEIGGKMVLSLGLLACAPTNDVDADNAIDHQSTGT